MQNKPNQTQSQNPTPKGVGRIKEWPDEAQLLTCGTFSANIEHKDFLQHKVILTNKFLHPPYPQIAHYSSFKWYRKTISSGFLTVKAKNLKKVLTFGNKYG